MFRFPLPPQIIRLALLTVLIVGSYSVAQHFLTPASFGERGFYRALALEEAAAQPRVHAGQKACDECHSEVLQQVAKAEHKTLACETCHGPGRAHADNPDIKTARIDCTRCHAADPARPAWYHQVDPKKHYPGQACIECHLPHQPNEVP